MMPIPDTFCRCIAALNHSERRGLESSASLFNLQVDRSQLTAKDLSGIGCHIADGRFPHGRSRTIIEVTVGERSAADARSPVAMSNPSGQSAKRFL
jgi:hypothetical protein